MNAATLLRPASTASPAQPLRRTFVHGRPHLDLGHCYTEIAGTGSYGVHTSACHRTGSSTAISSRCVPDPAALASVLAAA